MYKGEKLMNYFEQLKTIFNENKDKRIVVLGTSCTGKTTIINKLNMGLDMDEEIFPLLTKEESDYVCSTPWTEEIGIAMDNFVRSRLKVVPGFPMFGTVLLDCDLIIYIDISDDLLLERVNKRGVNFSDVKRMKEKIESEINNSDIDVIILNITKESENNNEEDNINKYRIW